MIKSRFFLCFLVITLVSWKVYAETIEYKYYFTPHSIKDIQLMWNIETTDDIEFEDYTYTIDTKFKWETIIPKYTVFEQKLIDMFWYEKLNKLFSSHIIKIWWTDNRVVNNIVSKWEVFEKMKIENKQELNTNLLHKRVIRIQSDKDKKIIFKLYPVNPHYYSHSFNHTDMYYLENWTPDKNTILTIYDTTQEYYNLSWKVIKNLGAIDDIKNTINNNWPDLFVNDDIKIEKKYELFNFKRKWYNQKDWISKSYLPYYKISFNVSEWTNDLYLNYETYQFPNEPLQIK